MLILYSSTLYDVVKLCFFFFFLIFPYRSVRNTCAVRYLVIFYCKLLYSRSHFRRNDRFAYRTPIHAYIIPAGCIFDSVRKHRSAYIMLELPNNDGDVIDRAGKILSGPVESCTRKNIVYVTNGRRYCPHAVGVVYTLYCIVYTGACVSLGQCGRKKKKMRKEKTLPLLAS